MSTNAEILGDAHKEINVIGETDSLSAEQGSYGLRVMNDLIESWTMRGINLGYFAQTDTTATCPIPAWAKMGVISSIAIAMAPNYGATVSIELRQKAEDGYQAISRQAALEKIQPLDDRHLPWGTGWTGIGRWDITQGP
jgi:hypothetical protein